MKQLFFFIFLCFIARPTFATEKAAKIVVHKSARQLQLLDAKGAPIKTYSISLGDEPTGHKSQEGDEKTPEGLYTISGRNPKSRYHLSLRVSYPNSKDIAHAHARGVSPGGDIMIHGLPNGFGWMGKKFQKLGDWTDGCIAVTNHEIEEIWNLVPDGTPIQIKP